MKTLNKSIKSVLACLLVMVLGSSVACAKGGRWTVSVNLSASPSTIDAGQSATLSWSSSNASSCSASWTSSSATSGSESVSPAQSTTYSISCTGSNGSASDSATVVVNAASDSGGFDLVGDYVGGINATQVYDTSFAVEFSYSCLSGGCHETNQALVDEYAASKMTHAMVKCNACHGTHTADTVGLEKPNLTGYYPGVGATGYSVDTDRCKVCHNNEHTGGNKGGDNCYSCHTPHVFGAGGGGRK